MRIINISIKATPNSSNKINESKTWMLLFGENNHDRIKIKYKIGSLVRIAAYKKIFDKSYTNNWSKEVFKIIQIIANSPPLYKVIDLEGEEIEGNFYEEELQLVQEKQFSEGAYLIEKKIDKRVCEKGQNKGKKQTLVKFVGFDNRFNRWINDNSIEK